MASSYPVQVNFLRPQQQSRLMALFSIPYFLIRFILLIPHIIVVYVLFIVGIFTIWFGFWAVLFMGRYPEGLYNFNSGILRWSTRMAAYLYGMTDAYPPFRLSN